MLLEDTQEDRRLNYIANLRGARLAICNEGSKQRRLDSRGMKALSGGGLTTGRRLCHQPIQFQQTHKLLILANDPPVLELDDAMMQRVHVVPFNQTFRDTDREQKGLRDFFAKPEQLKGIFQWAVDGCLAWQKEGLKPPASVRATTKQYFADADLFEQFLNEKTQERGAVDVFMSSESGFQCWAAWCERQGYKDRNTIGTTRTFADTLLKKRPHLKLDRFRFGQSVRTRGFAGIELLVEEYDRNRGEQYDATR
jgi:putative DNA primase/helicase